MFFFIGMANTQKELCSPTGFSQQNLVAKGLSDKR